MFDRSRGFIPIVILVVVLASIGIVGGGAVLYRTLQSNRTGSAVTHEDLEKVKELTRTLQNKSPKPQPTASQEQLDQYRQKEAQIKSEMQSIAQEDPNDITWEDIGMFLEHVQDLRQLGDESGTADSLMEKIRERAEELMAKALQKDICSATLADIKDVLTQGQQARLLGAEVEGLFEWAGDAIESIAADRVDNWPAEWPPDIQLNLGSDREFTQAEVAAASHATNCKTANMVCERMDFAEMAGLLGNTDLMTDILHGNFNRIKAWKAENCVKGCCLSGGVAQENIPRITCERLPSSLWQKDKCKTGYKVSLAGTAGGSGDVGAVAGKPAGALQKMFGGEMSVELKGVADLTTCSESVNSTWKGTMNMTSITNNKQLGTKTTNRKSDMTIPFDSTGNYEMKANIMLAKIGFSAKITGNTMTVTRDFGGALPTLVMQGTIEKGKVVCNFSN